MVNSLSPCTDHSVIYPLRAFLIKLHDCIISIRMPAGACKHWPVRIPSDLTCCPVRLCHIVQSLQNPLIRRFCVQRRFCTNLIVPLNIFPVIFSIIRRITCIVPCSQIALVIPSMSWLEHMKIYPVFLCKPHRGCTPPKRVKSNQLIRHFLLQICAKLSIQRNICICLNISA